MCVHTTDTINKFWMWSVAISTLQSWPSTIRLSSVWSLGKKACEDSVTPIVRHCRMPRASDCRQRRAHFCQKGILLFFKGAKQLSWKMGTTLKNNYAFNNNACKFCKLFTCQIFKYHVIKNIRNYVLMDPWECVWVCVHVCTPHQSRKT